ncbi:DNA polymerase III subunit delta [Leucobacter luti]|uniref:DNA-directed DNA polymerase n=1 Tax=Leucobacter luti TaxID=340320 RepID=A0A4V6MCJ7_9MICO|nr:DNA polymerase III subunit delta [Leucobacter luti]MBL3698107.1 DNA polymerase III subunit delta [Leucobacter luti]RZT64809.1 DNA polymerase III delta subunit [Leucobacter luti]
MAAARATQTKAPQLDWSEARPAPVVLISGPEAFLADRAAQAIRSALVAEHPDLEVHDVDAASYAAGEIFTLASPSLFAEPRLLRVEGVEKCSDAFIEDVKRYIAEPADDTVLVLRHGGGQRGKALLDLLRKGTGGAIEIACPEVKKDADRLSFAQAEFRRLGAQITPGALRMLVGAYAGGIGELAGACVQLVSDVGTRISEDEVNRATEGRVETNAFRVADAATAGRGAEALVLLRQALSTGTDPIPLLAALNMKVRAMARVYGASGGSGQLAKELGMAPWQVDRAQREVRGWREGDLARCIDQAAETEWLLKGGTRDPEYALEKFVLLVARRGRAK